MFFACSSYLGKPISLSGVDVVDEVPKGQPESQNEPNTGRTRRASTGTKESYEIVKDLSLRPGGDKQAFKDLCSAKSPQSNIEFNVLAVYYLKKVLNVPKVSLSHIYTCYKEIPRKVGGLRQSVLDASGNRYGYLDAGDLEDIKIPTRGENLVEHELPKAKR